MSDDVTRRIDEAAARGARAKETAEFLNDIKGQDMIKPVYNPEAWVMRDKAKGAANRGELPKTACTHPLQSIQQYVDDDPSIKRSGKPVNLFACGICGMLLWFTDPWGQAVGDA